MFSFEVSKDKSQSGDMELQNMFKRCSRCCHVVIDGNLCSNLGVSQGRLSNIYIYISVEI